MISIINRCRVTDYINVVQMISIFNRCRVTDYIHVGGMIRIYILKNQINLFQITVRAGLPIKGGDQVLLPT